MGGWIKWEKDLENDPRFRRMVKDILTARGIDPCNATPLQVETHVTLLSGGLVRMWAHADTYLREDDTFDMSAQDMNAYLGIPEFSFVCCRDWFEEREDGRVQLPGFHDKNSPEQREKDQTAKRVARHRAKQRNASPLPDQTRPDQTRLDQTIRKSGVAAKNGREGEDSRAPPRQQVQDDFESMARIQRAYPPFAGNQADWQLAERACLDRLGEGATWDELEAGARRFAAFVTAGGRSGPQYVDLPSKFFGNGLWKQPWTPPATKAETRLVGNLDAAAEAKRQLFGDANGSR